MIRRRQDRDGFRRLPLPQPGLRGLVYSLAPSAPGARRAGPIVGSAREVLDLGSAVANIGQLKQEVGAAAPGAKGSAR